MKSDMGIHGWIAAITVGLIITAVALVVDKELRRPPVGYYRAAGTADARSAVTQPRGIVLAPDPGLIATEQFPLADRTQILREGSDRGTESAQQLRKPPEPSMQVVLRAPTAQDLDVLPLSSSTANIDYLMDAIDRAFESPMQTVSNVQETSRIELSPQAIERLSSMSPATNIGNQLPTPNSLLVQLEELHSELRGTPSRAHYVSELQFGDDQNEVSADRPLAKDQYVSSAASSVGVWIEDVTSGIKRLVQMDGLGKPAGKAELEYLSGLAAQAKVLAANLDNASLSSKASRIGYALERRVAVWRAVSACLNSDASPLKPQPDVHYSRQQIRELLVRIDSKLPTSGDQAGWRKYLKMNELHAWCDGDIEVWDEGNKLAVNVLSRLRWERMNEQQRSFLKQAEFEELAAHLTTWARQPIDYRQLLTDLELLEEDSINRVRFSLANAVQTLRLANEPNQQAVSAALNDHYRNANIRIAIAGSFIERFLPDESYQTKPVHQRILGANTFGDSVVRTQLDLRLVPDPNAWHIGLGVQGDLVSATRSSKGPAVFHNSSQAHITGERVIRMDPLGFKVSASETRVDSQQHLRGMNTDFDGLPIVGDFLRLIIREQFDQQKGLAKRVMHRMIAEETDQEFDKQLQQQLNRAQVEMQRRLIGPLEAFNLNPMVVAMGTTDERLMIRYRVANQAQMASHTARPRAPSDSLLSMQIHQSAVNNTIAQLGLSDRAWNLVELGEKISSLLGKQDWKAPAEMPKDVTIRFAPSRPISVEMVDNQLLLTLRIAELSQGQSKFERFIIRTSYVPVADGLKAGLVREGVVSIDGPRMSMRDRLPLRAIFGTVFVSRPEIPLVSESLVADPRAQGLAVTQLEVCDGWLAIAIADSNSSLASEVARRAQQQLVR